MDMNHWDADTMVDHILDGEWEAEQEGMVETPKPTGYGKKYPITGLTYQSRLNNNYTFSDVDGNLVVAFTKFSVGLLKRGTCYDIIVSNGKGRINLFLRSCEVNEEVESKKQKELDRLSSTLPDGSDVPF